MRRHEDVHRGERHRRRHGVEEQRTAEAARDGEDDRQHDDESGVEEDREAEEQRGHAERQRCPFLTEGADQSVGEHLGAAGELEHASEHRTESHEQGHAGQGGSEAVVEDVDEVGRQDARGQCGGHTDDGEGDEGVQSGADDEHEQQGDGRCGQPEQRRRGQVPGQFDIGHCSSSLR